MAARKSLSVDMDLSVYFSTYHLTSPLPLLHRWSEQSSSSSQQRQRQYRELKEGNDGNAAKSCGQSGGDNSNSWYVGMGKCMGSNVAFSLYGVLVSDSVSGSKSPCSQKTFINSFYTTDGLSSFVQASNGAIDTSYINQQCAWYDDNKKYTTTLGCSANGRFTTDTFVGSGCFGYNYNYTVDDLQSLNDSLQGMECKLIYSSDGSVNYASTLLSYSDVCSTYGINKYFCPDPYKLISKYQYNFAMAQKNSNYTVVATSQAAESVKDAASVATSFLLLVAGVALFATSAVQYLAIKRNKKISEGSAEPDRPYGVLA